MAYEIVSGLRAPFSWLVRGAGGRWTFADRGDSTDVVWRFRFDLTTPLVYPIGYFVGAVLFSKSARALFGGDKAGDRRRVTRLGDSSDLWFVAWAFSPSSVLQETWPGWPSYGDERDVRDLFKCALRCTCRQGVNAESSERNCLVGTVFTAFVQATYRAIFQDDEVRIRAWTGVKYQLFRPRLSFIRTQLNRHIFAVAAVRRIGKENQRRRVTVPPDAGLTNRFDQRLIE